MKTVCCGYVEKISLLVDDMLEQVEKQSVQQHLNHCSACARYARELVAIKTSLSSIKLQVPGDLSRAVVSQLKQENRKSVFRRRILISVPSLAAACLVLVAALLLSQNIGPIQQEKSGISLTADNYLQEPNANRVNGCYVTERPAAIAHNRFVYVLDEPRSIDEFLGVFREEFPDIHILRIDNQLVFEAKPDILSAILRSYGLVEIDTYFKEPDGEFPGPAHIILFN